MAKSIAERSDILPKLAELFREYGYTGASLSLITQRTGLGKGSLYHFFPGGKEEMAEAVLAEIAAWFEDNLFNRLQGVEIARGLDHMFEAVTAYFHSGQRVCLVGAFALNDERDRFQKQIRAYFQRWVHALAEAFRSAGLEQAGAVQLAQEVVGGIQGAIVLSRALAEPGVFLDAITRMRDRCHAGLDTLGKMERR